MLTDQGIIEGRAFDTLRLREQLCPEVQILADVHVKHAVPLGPIAIEISARDTLERGLADALIISGTGTGVAAELRDLERVRSACPNACILLGSGINVENASEFLKFADGAIVGSSLKCGGVLDNPVDPKRVTRLSRSFSCR
jgi:membrane complex biogenesis BtpA family protein